jgi:hypothetical protein
MSVARHEVPGKRPPKEPSRRVRYDRAQLIPEDNWGGGTATPISVLQGRYLKRGHRTEGGGGFWELFNGTALTKSWRSQTRLREK